MKIARVFPRKTRATPDDDMAFINTLPPFFVEADEVHISTSFTWDLMLAEWLAREWAYVAPVKIGGPALMQESGEFIPGKYLKMGYVITSRGCPNKCWFCSVWKRENGVKELPITEGWNVLDDNLLACSEQHIRSVFQMLKKQPQKAQFTGGFEAARLTDWQIDLLVDLQPKQMFFAYDTDDDRDPLFDVSRRLHNAGFNRQKLRCYVLIGYPGDTIQEAISRLTFVKNLGICPMAMAWRDKTGKVDVNWSRLQREWARPAIIYQSKVNEKECV